MGQSLRMRTRMSWYLTLALCTMAGGAWADTCSIAGQTPMLIARLYFGESMPRHGSVSQSRWSRFLRDAVTPRFPNGFTVYDGYGQWKDPASQTISRERSKIVEIAAPDTSEVRTKIEEMADIYKRRFHQQSVGIVTVPGCGVF